jgi:hypothetical protein
MPRNMRIRPRNQDDRPGRPSAEERKRTNQPFDEKANREMIEREARKKRGREEVERRSSRAK